MEILRGGERMAISVELLPEQIQAIVDAGSTGETLTVQLTSTQLTSITNAITANGTTLSDLLTATSTNGNKMDVVGTNVVLNGEKLDEMITLLTTIATNTTPTGA